MVASTMALRTGSLSTPRDFRDARMRIGALSPSPAAVRCARWAVDRVSTTLSSFTAAADRMVV